MFTYWILIQGQGAIWAGHLVNIFQRALSIPGCIVFCFADLPWFWFRTLKTQMKEES